MLGRRWSALVGCGRRRRRSIVNRSISDSVRGSGGCLVDAGRLWSGVGAGDAVPLSIAVDLTPLEGLVVAWSALVGSGRVWAPATLFHCKSQ